MPVFIANRQWVAVLLAVFMAVALSACGGGGSTSAPQMPDPGPMPDPQMACEDAGGRYNADGTCTSAEDLAAEQLAMERGDISTAIMAATTAVNAVNNDSTDAQVSAADTAITNAKNAIAAATNVPAGEKAANTQTVNALENQLSGAKTARQTAMDAADEAMKAAMAKTGKALRAALGPDSAGTTALNNIAAPVLAATGLTIDAAAGAGALPDATDPALVELKAGDPAGSLGSWMGMDYARTTGTGASKLTNEARVYTNQGAPKSVTFAKAGYTVATATSGADIDGYLTLDVSDAATLGRILGATFTHSGTQTHQPPRENDPLYVRGTYDGAPGEYRCTGACSSTNDGKGSPSALAGTWHFKPDAGAMVSQPDDTYLYYGWWVSKDKDGGPTAASAFTGIVQPAATPLAAATAGGTLTGSATYVGHAAGKFAMSNTLDGTGNGGHFTADAELKATFGSGTTAGMTGTIDNFRLNDGSEDPGWSVSLARGAWDNAGGITAPASDPTVWSIDGNKAPASGTWSGQMYDEKPGDPPAGDGSTVPTTVTGTFYSEFSTIGRMVGAFGADKQ